MATYRQWQEARLRRCTWVCGHPVLAEEVVSRARRQASPDAYVALAAGRDSERDIWDACAQLPLTPGETRMVVVRSAQKLRGQEALGPALAARGVSRYLMFVSDDDGYYQRKDGKPATDGQGRKLMQPLPALIQAAAEGQVVRCVLGSEADQVAWVQSRLPGLGAAVAWRVLERSGMDLALASSLCASLALWPPRERTEALAQWLSVPAPGEEFTEALVCGRKAAAMAALPGAEEELGAALGLLGSLLDPLASLYDASLQQLSVRDCVKAGIPQIWAARYRTAARDYPPSRILSCRMLLAEADAAWRGGAREGVAEVVAALW